MSKEIITPDVYKDAEKLISADGFATSNVWYHGTSSSLAKGIKNKGLHGGGDSAWIKRTQGTLKTIGNRTFESSDPVFLTQSKELAYFWAQERSHARNLYFQKDEKPVVFAVTLNDSDNAKVITDAGGAALLMEPNNAYIKHVREIYKTNGLDLDDFDPREVDRMVYMNRLGLAYCNEYIPGKFLELLSDS